jgi:parvin
MYTYLKLNDGVYFILLMGLLEGYFVPDHAYNWPATTAEQRQANCKLLFELIDDAGLPRPNCNPDDIATGDLKSILRILYLMFSNYKDRD